MPGRDGATFVATGPAITRRIRMFKLPSRTGKSGLASTRLAAVALSLGLGALGGCAPAEYGSIDIEKSKAIAAEKGIGPGASRPAAKQRGQAPGPPTAPAPR